MKSNNFIGTCALCNRKNIQLKQSHIIPKLVYRRLKTYKNSRFRNYFNFNEIFQDGEKKPMLCGDCEQFFSKYEAEFTNKFFDKYLTLNNQTLPLLYDGIQNYIISVSWRILYDDLFVYNSFHDSYLRITYESLEKRLRKYLNQIRTDNIKINKIHKTKVYENQPRSFGEIIAACEEYKKDSTLENLKNIDNYIFTLKELGYSDEVIKLLDSFVCGYCYNTKDEEKYIIFSLYKGLVIATMFFNNKANIVPNNMKCFFKHLSKKNQLKSSLKEEIDHILKEMKNGYFKNQEILNSNNTREKIEKRYENAKKK